MVHDATLPLYGSRIYKNIITTRINCMKRYATFPRTNNLACKNEKNEILFDKKESSLKICSVKSTV